MNISIYSNPLTPDIKHQKAEDNNSFNDVVLAHIKSNQPDGELVQLLDEMRALSPEMPVTMQKLSSALLYSDTILRSDPDYINYTCEILDKRTSQLLGLNMLTNIMLNNISHNYDEDKDQTFL